MTMIEEIKAKNLTVEDVARIAGSPLEGKRGTMFRCPFHEERTPSFSVFDDGRRFHCFGCGDRGDVIDFWARTTGQAPAGAIKTLAEKLGIEGGAPMLARPARKLRVKASDEESAPTDRREACKRLAAILSENRGHPVARWAESKGIRPQMLVGEARSGRAGLTPDGKLLWIYPHGVKIRHRLDSSRGDRWLEGHAASNVMGDGPHFDNGRILTAWLCEGESDRLRLMQEVEGPRSVVLGIPGASQAPDERLAYRLLAYRDVICCFDGDVAGRKATDVWRDAAESAGATEFFDMELPDEDDICALSDKELKKKIALAQSFSCKVC